MNEMEKIKLCGRGIDLQSSSIQELPENLKVLGDLNISKSNIKALPNGLRVEGDLIIEGTSINSLPDGLYVGGDLNLKGLPIKCLPKNIHVGGNLWLSSEMRDLHECENLIVGRSLIPYDYIIRLPKKVRVGKDLHLAFKNIEELPEGLYVGGKLDLSHTKNIKTLPSGLTVEEDLDISDSRIEHLPSDMTVKGNLIMKKTHISSFNI